MPCKGAAALARIIHEHFCCNRRSAATTSLQPAGSPLGPSPYCWGLAPFFLAPVPGLGAGQAPPQTAEPVPWAPRAGLATRLRDFATNRHELCGLAVSTLLIVGVLAYPCGAQTPSPAPPVQSQAVQPPQAEPSAGVSGQANVGLTSVPAPGVGSSTSSSVGKRLAPPDKDSPECQADRRSRDRWGPRTPQAGTCAPR